MTWELKPVKDIDATLDESGVYVVINRIVTTDTHKQYAGERVVVRADLMTSAGEPIVSFIGKANAVRKHLIRFNEGLMPAMSLEHASYIGHELLRAELDPRYVQD